MTHVNPFHRCDGSLKPRCTSTTVAPMRRMVAFDLDGVLYSSAPFLGDAYREAIANVKARQPGSFPRVPQTREILDHVGWPVSVILARLFPTIDPTVATLLSLELQEVICRCVVRGEGVLFDGVAPTLAQLRNQGWLLALASNGRRRYIEAVLSTYGLTDSFVELVSLDSQSRIKVKAEILRAYLRRERLTASRLVMVGDRTSDVEAAQAVGCAFVGCDYGHGHRDEIAGVGPIIAAFGQVPAALEDATRGAKSKRGNRRSSRLVQ
jgi:phosphoglycolate phosphatase